jgi:protein-tyrosine phosphatase
LEWLEKMVKWVDAQRTAGLTTYVHCVAGVSRSGMVITAYFMYKNGWTRDEALAFVKSKRPPTRPNPAFMELLLEWEKKLKRDSAGD